MAGIRDAAVQLPDDLSFFLCETQSRDRSSQLSFWSHEYVLQVIFSDDHIGYRSH